MLNADAPVYIRSAGSAQECSDRMRGPATSDPNQLSLAYADRWPKYPAVIAELRVLISTPLHALL